MTLLAAEQTPCRASHPVRESLGLAENVVLALLSESPSHGWAIGDQLEPGSELGRIWSADRPRIYRALRRLAALGLIETSLGAPGHRAIRMVSKPSEPGVAFLSRWLREPIYDIAAVHPELVLKLAFLRRLGRDIQPLLTAQRRIVETDLEPLEPQQTPIRTPSEIDRSLRREMARALLAFIDALS